MRRGGAALVALSLVPAALATGEEIPVPAVEHHLHIRSSEGAAVLRQLLDSPPGEGAEQPTARYATDALAALDAASVERGVVLSLAYMFGSPAVEVDDERELVRRENDFVAEQVARAPDRLIGACSVNPLASYALEEVGRCAADRRIGALKLHLANSEVDLENGVHVEALGALFGRLAELELPVIVHVRNREAGYGAAAARTFIDAVLSRAPGLPVQVAHMAGWGGYDEATDAALGVFVEALIDGRLDGRLIGFDLGAVVFQPEAAGDDLELAETVRRANRRLAERIRELGVERVLFATDWPSWPPIADEETKIARNARLIAEVLPLSPDEMARLFGNVGSVVEHAGVRLRSVASDE